MAEAHDKEPIIASSSRETESVTTVPCAICRRQFSRYTCPRCNISYCSLVCFRSEKHGDCSESFYRKEVELDVKNTPSANVQQKRRMMDLLKRFEEDALDESPLLGDSDNEDEEDEDDLQKRLENVNLDSASYEELWSALTPAERDKFLRALKDPDSELAQQLLTSEELQKERIEPWWETTTATEPEPPSMAPSRLYLDRKPILLAIPDSLVRQSTKTAVNGPLLLYNTCALCIAYAYAIRHFAVSLLSSLSPTDPDRAEIRRSVSHLLPFLVDRKSTIVHTSLSGVVTDLWSRFPAGHMDPQFFSLLLKDTATILRPAHVTVVASLEQAAHNVEDHPSVDTLRVLSDLASLFNDAPTQIKSLDAQTSTRSATSSSTTQQKPKPNHVVHKLTFYAAYILGTPAPMLRVLADEATMRAKTLENEGSQAQRERRHERRADVRRVSHGSKIGAARIEEL